ncbi:hypothetical protein [Flavobacterium gawalongense]|uniref:Uncharacterized protein n=1 Tax=Flavobacterium gawalongense TaxID=2594432 RepID=A0A553BWB4_9FLAO|nr:hypothetical protein [Flavobacterium gawalongense]TRX12513.1 hypothetical protein FNW11_02965 [Flavobacterium gawalongense]TRX12666.1 hypothetical protein FNW10_03690 [Flavobacterium gawalongense]TRX30545.1 hypothetical protein FNW38_04055 [Flavobacterium gawalongense]
MKLFFLLFLFIPLDEIKKSPSDFENELNYIVKDFREDIMDEYKCKKLMNNAGSISDEIEEELKETNKYTSYEISQLRELKTKADALQSYIGGVGSCASAMFPSFKEFEIANQMVFGSVTYVNQGKFCVDFISVTIGSYVVYMAKNSTSINYTVKYNWKNNNGTSKGNGTMGLPEKTLRSIYNNRSNQTQKKITVLGVTCIPF